VTTPAEPSSSGGGNVFTRKIGPLPMWAWMGIALAVALGFYLIKSKSSSTAASTPGTGTDTSGAGGVDSSLVPQFVNQTYVNNTPPAAPTATSTPPKGTPVKDGSSTEQLTRTWESEGGSTYAAVASRLTGTPTTTLTPANAAAKTWMTKVYAKNKNAKMPKGLLFTYTEGTVTTKS
jgi:hypothetical protein